MRSRWSFIYVLLALLWSLRVWGFDDKNLMASYLNITTGLPNNFVDDIYQDSQGFIWVSTQGGGLARYDGFVYRYLGVGLSAYPLRSNFCHNVTEDRHGRLWAAFDEGTQVISLRLAMPVSPEGTNDNITRQFDLMAKETGDRVYCDSRGAVWVLTRQHLYRLTFDDEGRVNQMASLAITTNPTGGCLRDLDKDGSVYVSYSSALWHVSFSGGKLRAENLAGRIPAIRGRYVTDVLKVRGLLWIATSTGLFRSDGRQWHSATDADLLPNDFVTSLEIVNGQKLLVGTLCGITILDLNNGSHELWSVSSQYNPLSSNFVNCMFYRQGVLWVGTESGGIVKLSNRMLKLDNYVHSDAASSISPNAVNAMYVESNGTLWAGTVEGGLNRKADGSSAFTHYTTSNSRLSHNSVSTLTADSLHQLWIGTWGGGVDVMSLDHPGQIEPLRAAAGPNMNISFIGALAYDRFNDGMWIGANDGLFFYDMKTKRLEEPFKDCRDVRGCIGSVITPDGTLWMGNLGGMVQVDLRSRRRKQRYFTRKFWHYKLDQPSSGVHEKIWCFCLAKDGTLWLGSGGYGLYKMTKDKNGRTVFVNYSRKDGLPNNGVRGIAEDKYGRLWITTNNGLSVFNPKTQLFNNFDEQDGLVSAQFYFNSVEISSAGHVFLGSERGLIEIEGVDLSHVGQGKLRFTGLSVNNVPATPAQRYLKEDITLAKKIYLHESDRSFSIDFAVLNYSSYLTGTYSYRMKGYEKEWIVLPPGQHSVRYSTLPSGNYTFEVRFVPDFSSGKPQQISIDVHVSPYFFKSWWFICLLLLAAAYVGFRLYRYRIAKMREEEANALFQPIEEALRESENPKMLQDRIQTIISNQKLYYVRLDKTAKEQNEEDKRKHLSFMDRIIKCMEQNYANSAFGVQELCIAMGMSRQVIVKQLKEETGKTLTQFVRDYRLDMSRRLIMEQADKINIADVAYRVGFNDPKYFTRCFTKRYNITPVAFKEQCQTIHNS